MCHGREFTDIPVASYHHTATTDTKELAQTQTLVCGSSLLLNEA